ncbi:glycine zipper 2TM domain-containing protein [Limnohabitans radicicola]|uniref:Glycine zipper 2TM domain-containing protein n=1 Tax=Limnohabitans radicicola TaxID=2771427 RepID=A0A927FI46_9BURK|nr:glycine zipper 2TM domain-containing protein [Limnohabitans radicicola]MBD8051909.1 glycine zipper 2TM domain-containing protein [Limnohabitans radicicola]
MKSIALTSALLAVCSLAQAQEVGQVISRTPVYQQVVVPRQSCTQTPVAVQPQTSGAGALMGAIAGGAVGNTIGRGDGRALATMAGVIGGAILGDKIESPGATQTQTQTTCTTQNIYENRLVGYNVVYEFGGKQYTVQLPQDPGPTIQLQVTPVGAPRSDATPDAPPTVVASNTITTVTTQPRVVYVPTPSYYGGAWAPAYPVFNMGWGWNGGHRHGHWR